MSDNNVFARLRAKRLCDDRPRGAWKYFIMISLFSCLVVVPYVYLFSKAFTDIGGKFTLGNWTFLTQTTVLKNGDKISPALPGMLYSFLFGACMATLVVCMTVPAAYAMSRTQFPGRKLLYMTFLTTMFIGAGTVTMFPIMQMTSKAGMNNGIGLAIVQGATSGAANLFLTMGYLKTISKDLDDAAKIDGCSFFSIWWRIILPLSKPILATVALMTFRGSWNNYLLPTLMLAKYPEQKTLVVAVVQLQSTGGAGASQYNLMMAGTMLAAMPMIILFLCMNKMFVAGITQGAVKG